MICSIINTALNVLAVMGLIMMLSVIIWCIVTTKGGKDMKNLLLVITLIGVMFCSTMVRAEVTLDASEGIKTTMLYDISHDRVSTMHGIQWLMVEDFRSIVGLASSPIGMPVITAEYILSKSKNVENIIDWDVSVGIFAGYDFLNASNNTLGNRFSCGGCLTLIKMF